MKIIPALGLIFNVFILILLVIFIINVLNPSLIPNIQNKIQPRLDIGIVKIDRNAIASIAAIAAMEIEGVKQISPPRKIFNVFEMSEFKRPSIDVEFRKDDELVLNIPLIIKYGFSASDVAEQVKENVKKSVEKILNKTPGEVNIIVRGIE